MPKHIKDVKVGYFEYHSGGRDSHGIVVAPYVTHVADVWASVTGAEFSLEYNTNAWRNNPVIVVVFARCKGFKPKPGNCILYDGELYEIRDMDGLSEKVGRDVKLTCEWQQSLQGLIQ